VRLWVAHGAAFAGAPIHQVELGVIGAGIQAEPPPSSRRCVCGQVSLPSRRAPEWCAAPELLAGLGIDTIDEAADAEPAPELPITTTPFATSGARRERDAVLPFATFDFHSSLPSFAS